MKNIGIVIPTYNAKETIVDAIRIIKKIIPNSLIVVVDDNSPDGTADLVKNHFHQDKNVQLLKRSSKGGRGSAIITGFKKLYQNKNIAYFVEMDADLCHNPKYIKNFIEKGKNTDIVIASRYLPQSRIYGWNLKRKLMSWSINTFAKLMLRIPITDYTDGFRCYSRKAVALLSSYKLQSKGYIVLSETAYVCFKKGLTIVEIPIDFHFKKETNSNLNIREVKEALITLVKLRFRKL